MFGHQIQVEVASKGLLDLPAEIINQINKKLPLQHEKQFREVCRACPILRNKYKDEIGESGVMKLYLRRHDLSVKFVNDFHVITNSNLKLSVTPPTEYEICYVNKYIRHAYPR